jgi:hypothetical protein
MQAQLDSRSSGNGRLVFVMDKPEPPGVPFAPLMLCPTCATGARSLYFRMWKMRTTGGAWPEHGLGVPISRPCSGRLVLEVAHVLSIHVRGIGAGDSETKIDPADHIPLTDKLALCLAGEKAGKLFECPLPPWTARSDREKVLTLLLGLSSHEDEEQRVLGYARAHALLLEHRDGVISLAVRLLEAHEVDAAEFLDLMHV